MKRMPLAALSIFLAPPLAMAFSFTAFSAPGVAVENHDQAGHRCCTTTATGTQVVIDDETCRKLQPGRLETAREIKDQADAFISKGRELSLKMNAQIAEAVKLKNEAVQLRQEAENLKERGLILIAQQPATVSKPEDSKPAAESAASAEGKTPADAASAGTAGGAAATGSAADAKSGDAAKEEKLTGRASTLQTMPMPNIPLIKLRGPQLQQAMKQYNTDVEQFKIHAADYNKHYNLFKSQIGECHAARSAFDDLHKKYEMHCTAYHLNNIPPPRLCPPMAGSVAEANSIANQLRSDQMRALRAEGQLRQEEGRLRELEGMQSTADALVVKGAERDRREREIAGMFGRLRQEYDLLEIERKTIEHSKGGKASAPVARPYVSGKIKKGK